MNKKIVSAGVGFGTLVLAAGFGLSVFAKGQPTDLPRGPKASPTPVTLNVACMQSAITERDNSVISAVNAYHASIVSMLGVRRDAFVAAWALTDRTARKDAMKAALDTFRDARKNASNVFRRAKEDAWKEFEKDRKACGVGSQDGQGNARLDSAL